MRVAKEGKIGLIIVYIEVGEKKQLILKIDTERTTRINNSKK